MSIFDEDAFGGGKKNNAIILQLFNAASRNRLDEVVTLLTTLDSTKYDLQEEVNGINSFLIACKKGHTSIAEIFVKYHPTLVESCTSGNQRNGLMLAAFEGHDPMVQYLSQFDAMKLARDNTKNNALHYASWGGHLNIVKYLIDQCAYDPSMTNAEGLSALQFATAGNHIEVIQYLTNKLDFNEVAELSGACSESGYNSLHRAALCGSLEALKLLLPCATADVASVTSSSSTLALVDAKAVNGSTCLHLAAHHGHLNIVTFLVTSYGANVHATNDYGLTPLMFACIGGHTAIVRFLIMDHGADTYAANAAGANALHLAAASGKHDICQLLYENMVAMNTGDRLSTEGATRAGCDELSGQPPSSSRRNFDVTTMLDGENQSPIDAALASGYKELAAKLAMWSCIELRAQRLALALAANPNS